MLSSMGVEVVDERPYQLDDLDRPSYIYEFGLRYAARPARPHARGCSRTPSARCGTATTRSTASTPWCSAAGLTWRQATVLRAYAKYMKQGNSPFALDYIEEALRGNIDITRLLVQLFEARFDPGATASPPTRRPGPRGSRRSSPGSSGRSTTSPASTTTGSCAPTSPTSGRRCAPTTSSSATDGEHHAYMSFKLEPSEIPDLPQPRPRFEIFVYSPRVEGVHLRFGAVARGGLRWSDRRDDFRTEVLGLVKAQMVKNTVIVPVGAKGGFFCKQLPDPADRDAWLAEGVACYKTFICGLLDITDNLVDGETVPPRGRRTPRRRRLLPRGRGRQGHRDVLRHRQRRRQGLRLLARRRVRLRRLGRLRPQGDGHHRARRLGLGAAPLPRARHRLPDRGLHLRRHRRHVRRRVRQRAALLRAHPAGRRLRPPRHLPRPEPRRRDVVRRAQAAVRAAAVELAGLRHLADLRGWRRLPALAEVDPAHRAGPQGARPRRRRHGDDAGRADEGDPAGAGRPALERRHRHLREGERARPTPTSATRPTTRSASTAASCARAAWARAATSA